MPEPFKFTQQFNCYNCHRLNKAYTCTLSVKQGRKCVTMRVDKPAGCHCMPYPPGTGGAIRVLAKKHRTHVMEEKRNGPPSNTT